MLELKIRPTLVIAAQAVVLLLGLGVSSTVDAMTNPLPPPMGWRAGDLGFAISNEYFNSRANYDTARGSFTRLTGDSSFSAFESRLSSRYALSDRFGLQGGFGLANVRAIDATTEKTNSQLTDAFITGDFFVWRKWLRAVAQIEVSYPISAVDRTQTQPLTSDGVPYVRAGLFLAKPWRWIRVASYLGFHLPLEGLAKRFTYDLNAQIPLGSSFSIGAGIDGYEAAISDELSFSERTATPIRANAGSFRFYAHDPALMEGRVWVGFKPGAEWDLRAGYAMTIDGMRTAQGNSLLLSIAFNPPLPARPSRGSTVRQGPVPSEEEALKKFKPEEEKVDETIFSDDIPPPEEPQADLDEAERQLEKNFKK